MTNSNPPSPRVLELADEFLDRYRRGERPPLGEYAARYPELAAEIREVFPAIAMMERVALADESIEGRRPPPGPELRHGISQLGDFRILREVGRGGMGVVFEAEQVSLGRHVALKVLPERLLTDPKQRSRFEREAKAAARLHHTNIVPVFGVGEDDGTPYYAMQFIPGLGLDQVINELKRQRADARPREGSPAPAGAPGDVTITLVARSLLEGRLGAEDRGGTVEESAAILRDGSSPREPVAARSGDPTSISSSSGSLLGLSSGDGSRLDDSPRPTYWRGVARIGSQVADALAYAHSQGILHRDIKPSNLLLDARGVVWVTDFGLAKIEDQAGLTHTGDILGTLRYMPPEAFEGRHDSRGDVYSLGLSLYEMLAFRPAFDEADRGRLIRQVTAGEPPRLRALNPEVPRDLETVVHKAIERDPSHRYATAALLAEDLRRYMEDRPILARRASESEKFRRWCRRNPVPAGLLATLFFVFWSGFGLVAWKWREAVAEREAKDIQRLKAVASERDAGRARDRAEEERGKALASADRAGRGLYYSQIARARLEHRANNIAEAESILDRSDPARRGWEWHFLKGLVHAELFGLEGHDGWVSRVAYSPDGKLIASAGGGNAFLFNKPPSAITPGAVILWDAETGRPVRTLRGHAHLVLNVAFSPDGKLIASASHDGTTRLYDVATGDLVRSWGGGKRPFNTHFWVDERTPLAFSPDGKWLAMGMDDGTVTAWNVASGARGLSLPARKDGYDQVHFSPDGRKIATLTEDSTGMGREVQIWDAATGLEAARPENGKSYFELAISPDSRFVAGASAYDSVTLWRLADGKFVRSFSSASSRVRSLAFSPDGQLLAGGGEDSSVPIWQVEGGRVERVIRGHRQMISGVAFSPDGNRLVTGSRDGTSRVWDLSNDPEIGQVVSRYGAVEAIAYADGGRTIAWLDRGGHATRFESGSHVPLGMRLSGLHTEYASPAQLFGLDGEGRRAIIVDGSDRRRAVCLDLVGDDARAVLQGHRLRIFLATLSADGRVAATGGFSPPPPQEIGGEVIAWDVAAARPTFRWGSAREAPRRVALDPTGRLLAISAVRDGKTPFDETPAVSFLAVFDLATGREVFRQDPLAEPSMALGFSPDGRRLAAAGFNRALWIWDVETAKMVVTSAEAPELPLDLAFSPDGRRLAVASRQQVQLMDAESGEEVLVLRGSDQQQPTNHGINPRVRFSPDGTRILAICGEGVRGVSEWSAAPRSGGDLAARIAQARRKSGASLFHDVEWWWWRRRDDSPEDRWANAVLRSRLARLDLETPMQLLNRAEGYAGLDDFELAEADIARAAALAPGDEMVADEIGRILIDAGRLDLARRWLPRLGGRGRHPGDDQALKIAAVHILVGDLSGYRRIYRDRLAMHGPNAAQYPSFVLARMSVLAPGASDDPAEVIRLAERALALYEKSGEPKDIARLRSALAAAHDRAGDPTRAERLLLDVLAAKPSGYTPSVALARLAIALAHQGRRDEARARLAEADRLAPRRIEADVIPRAQLPKVNDDWEWQLARVEAAALLLDGGFPADPFAR